MTIQALKSKWLGTEFGNDDLDLFKAFDTDYTETLRAITVIRVTKHITGFFDSSFFIRRIDNLCARISIPDVRFEQDGWANRILVRLSTSENDYAGYGENYFCTLETLVDTIRRL